jgi:hypothetical protein
MTMTSGAEAIIQQSLTGSLLELEYYIYKKIGHIFHECSMKFNRNDLKNKQNIGKQKKINEPRVALERVLVAAKDENK